MHTTLDKEFIELTQAIEQLLRERELLQIKLAEHQKTLGELQASYDVLFEDHQLLETSYKKDKQKLHQVINRLSSLDIQ